MPQRIDLGHRAGHCAVKRRRRALTHLQAQSRWPRAGRAGRPDVHERVWVHPTTIVRDTVQVDITRVSMRL